MRGFDVRVESLATDACRRATWRVATWRVYMVVFVVVGTAVLIRVRNVPPVRSARRECFLGVSVMSLASLLPFFEVHRPCLFTFF